jgi:hypothetical protein
MIRRPRPEDEGSRPIPGLAELKQVTPPPSLVPAVMSRIAAEPRLQTAEASGPIPGLAELKQVTPPPSLVPAVMSRIAEPRPQTFWSWLLRPRRIELRLSPVGILAMVSGAAMLALAMSWRPAPVPVASVDHAPAGAETVRAVAAAPAPASDVVLVRFVLVAKGARKVAVAGDFNGWNAAETTLENSDGRGTFVATVQLPRGAHEYMFLVDGEWVTDPAAPETRPDGFGRSNGVLRL